MNEVTKAKEIANQAKKVETAQRDLKTKQEFLIKDINNGRKIGQSSIDVKYAANNLAREQKALDQLKK